MAESATPDRLEGTVLVTGASGFIGRRLRDALLGRGLDVVAIRRPASPETDSGRSVTADYADQARLDEIVATERPRHVFHVAGATKGVTYEDFRRANVRPTENLVSACKNAGHTPARFVLVSSLAAYGPSEAGAPLSEDAPRAPIEFYGQSKAEAEAALEQSGLPYTIVRPGGVYGPGDVDYFEVFKMVAKGWNVFFGNRDRYFSAVYVDDLVHAILAAAEHPAARDRGYFIATEEQVSWQTFHATVVEASTRRARELDLPEFFVDVAAWGGELLSRIDGKPRLFNRQKATMGRQDAWTCRADAARADFGFAPKIDLGTGVARALQWYRTEGWL